MAECIILKGGGGADLDVITAGAADVVAPKVIVDKAGNPVTGIMVERGAYTNAIVVWSDANSFAAQIPNGAYRTNSSSGHPEIVTPTVNVRAALGVESWKFRADTTIGGLAGGIPSQNAETGGDRAWATNMSNWAGTINLGVRNGHFLNGVNWIQQDIPNYQPWNIKKGVNIGGVVGTWEGYVPGATDLYHRGNNVAGWTGTQGSLFFEAGQITLQSYSCRIAATFSTVGRNYINIEGYRDALNSGTITLSYLNAGSSWENAGVLSWLSNGNYTQSISVAACQANTTFRLLFEGMQPAIYRIWLS